LARNYRKERGILMSRNTIAILCALHASAFSTSCATDDDTDNEHAEDVATNSERIINGTALSSDSRGTAALIIGSTRGCSSTLLSSRWLLTAHHCLTNEEVIVGGTPVTPSSVTAVLLSGATAIGKQVYLHPSSDVALLQLQSPLLAPSGAPYVNPLHAGASSGLVGQTLYCQGWGYDTFAGGWGTLRAGGSVVSQYESDGYQLIANAARQIPWIGDSGSSCWATSGFVTGVQSTCQYSGSTVLNCHQVGVNSFRDWARSVVNVGPAVYQPSTSEFFLRDTNSGGAADIPFGYGPAGGGWVPMAGDWNGDGIDTVGLYSPATSTFYLRNVHAGGAADITFGYGPAGGGWVPLAGDWNGDGVDTVGLYNPATSTFYLRNVHAGGAADITFGYGPAGGGWVPLVGDWNGDGVDTVGLYNPATGTFYLRNVHAGGAADITFAYGASGLKPLAGAWAVSYQ
jgi:hypothetical protein